jgi:hypothetical protein
LHVPKQRNETAAYTLLALLDLQPDAAWADAQAPFRGITPIIDFIATAYGNRYPTVTLLARLRGLSTSQPRATAMW